MPLTFLERLTLLKRGLVEHPVRPCSGRGRPPRRWRRELKFLVARHLRNPLVADLRAFVKPDPHGSPDGRYTVRSLYLDARDWRCFHDKAAGHPRRQKLRVRIYPDHAESVVKFEIKHHWSSYISKDVAIVDRAEYETLLPVLQSGRVGNGCLSEPTDARGLFLCMKQWHGMAPVLNVQFRRQAFAVHGDRSVRITLDDALTAAKARDVFEPPPSNRSLLPGYRSVLEVKMERALPYWLQRLIIKYHLRLQSFSKYGHAAGNGPFGLDGTA